MDRKTFIGAAIGGLMAAIGTNSAEGHTPRWRRKCEACDQNRRCTRKLKCVEGRCVPKDLSLVCGGAYKLCQNGWMPVCYKGVAYCLGNKPATPYCG